MNATRHINDQLLFDTNARQTTAALSSPRTATITATTDANTSDAATNHTIATTPHAHTQTAELCLATS